VGDNNAPYGLTENEGIQNFSRKVWWENYNTEAQDKWAGNMKNNSHTGGLKMTGMD